MPLIEKLFELSGHTAAIYTLTKTSENQFISGGGDGILALWETQFPKEGVALAKLGSPIFCSHYNRKYEIIFAGCQNGNLAIIHLPTKKLWATLKLPHLIFSISDFSDHTVLVATEKNQLIEVDFSILIISNSTSSIGTFRKIRLGKDSKIIGTTTDGSLVQYLDKSLLHFNYHQYSNSSLYDFMEERESVFILGGKDAKLLKINAENKIVLQTVDAHWFSIYQIQDLDNGFIITGSRDKTIRIWDKETLEPHFTIQADNIGGHRHSVNALLYFENQKILISTGDDKRIILWKINTLEIDDSIR